jgi:hypothetical protein
MKVRFMGGPSMNKRQDIHPDIVRRGRLEVQFLPQRSMSFSRIDMIDPTVPILRGYYKPSRNPEIWTWVGPDVSDPWKSYERRSKKWYKDYAKLASIGTPHDIIMNMMRPKPERPKV